MWVNRRRAKKLRGPSRAQDESHQERPDSAATAHPVEDEEMLSDPALVSISEGEEPQKVPPGI